MNENTAPHDKRSPRKRAEDEAFDRFYALQRISIQGPEAYVRAEMQRYDERIAAQQERKQRQEQGQADAVEALRAKLLGE